ncbi:MAG: DPP IV N-terminal domain-containing protein [Flavobacteriales bacterium]|nr:DPP IV N-terminal domain-containing protein [Flavobacteriales bacterium]
MFRSRISLAFVLFTLLLAPSYAQQKELTLRDAILKAGTDLAPERLSALQWIEGDNTYSYVKGEQLMRGTLGKSVDQPIAELSAVNAQLPDSAKLKAWPSITWGSPTRFTFLHNERLFGFETTAGKLEAVTRIGPGAENEEVDAVNKAVAFTVENNVYLMRVGIGKNRPVPITTDGADGIVNGKSVHRQEYGIEKGLFWGPMGTRLAFYRMDETMVTPYLLEDIKTKPSTFDKIRYPMAGQTSHHVTIGIHDLASGNTVFLKTGEPLDQYLTNISWEPDDKHLLVVHLDRKTENLRTVRYDAITGEAVSTVFTEHDSKYLEPVHPALFVKMHPTQFIWQSNRDGWDHLYLYDLNKGLIRQLTRGAWAVKEIVAQDPKGTFVVVEGTALVDPKDPKGALETHLYRVDLANGKWTKLTAEPGTHHGALSSNGTSVIDTWSSTSVANRSVVRDTKKGAVMKTLIDAADPYTGKYTVGTIDMISIAGERGDMLNARLIKPSHFDANKKYPVIIYVYNGPHVQLVTNSFLGGASPWMLNAAERGYLIWTVDGHGSQWRGRDFEQVIHRQLGVVEVEDQMRGVDRLKKTGFVDPARIAVHGWSFGGHMTTAMLTRHPETFATGVAGGPVMDWSLYEVMYTERYMDTPAENPDGYAATTLPSLANKLSKDLLIIIGGKDDTVLPEHSYSFLKACIAAGIQVDFFNYPGHGHNVRGKDRLHLMEKVLDYFDDRLLHTH